MYGSRETVEREFGRLKHEWVLLPLRPRPGHRAGPASRRPDDPPQARLYARPSACRAPRGVDLVTHSRDRPSGSCDRAARGFATGPARAHGEGVAWALTRIGWGCKDRLSEARRV